MDLIYFGDGPWGTNSLRRLISDGHRVLAVIVRHNPSDDSLANLARNRGIAVHRPKLVNHPAFVRWVRSRKPQLNVSMSYDQIFRQSILSTAPLGFINFHAGMLPRYRGRNVINWAIINGEKEIGLTAHYIDKHIDTGDIILQKALSLEWKDTYGTVLQKAIGLFPPLVSEAVQLIQKGEIKRKLQFIDDGIYFPKRGNGDEWIDWSDSSLNIYNKIRAITEPGPGARTIVDNTMVVITAAEFDPQRPAYIATCGQVVQRIRNKGVLVKTGDSTILITRVVVGDSDPVIPNFAIGTRCGLNLHTSFLELQERVRRLEEQLAGVQRR